MSRRRGRSRRTKLDFDPEVLRDYAVAFLIFVGIIAVGFVVWSQISPLLEHRSAQERAYQACVDGDHIQSHTIVLLDVTDTYTDAQKDSAVTVLRTLQTELSLGDKLTMYALTDQPFNPKQIGSACRPKTIGESSDLVEPGIDVETKWRQFQRDLRSALDAALSAEEAKASPIIEALQTLRDRPDFSPLIPVRKIVVISDMLQHGDTVSLYRDGAAVLSRERLAALLSATDLQNVEVIIMQVRRPPQTLQQSESFREFWASYFRDVGAWPVSCHPTSQGCPLK
jgi:hypothetical protein